MPLPLALGLAGLLIDTSLLAGALAAAYAATVILVGKGDELAADLQSVMEATGIDRLRGWLRAKEDIETVNASPLAQEVLISQGMDPLFLSQQLELRVATAVGEEVGRLGFPTFGTLAEADAWKNAFTALYTERLISEAAIRQAETWYYSEWSRLIGPAAVTAAPLATTFEVPGVGTVGVRVRVTGGAGAPTLVAPTPSPTFSPIINNSFNPVVTAEIDTRAMADELAKLRQELTALQQSNAVALEGTMERGLTGIGSQSKTGLAGLAAAISLAIAGVGTAVTTGLTANAGSRAHSAQQARYGCQSGFLDGLLGVFGKIGPQIAMGALLLTDNPIRQKLDELTADIIKQGGSLKRFVAPTNYDEAVANASSRLTQAVGFGLTAQAIAFTAEAMTPLKQMGFNQIAGFVADLAGFQRIAAGLMGTIENAAIYRPLMYEANRRYRPNIPDDRQLTLMFQKRSLTRGELSEFQEKLGLPDLYINRLPGFIFNDPNPNLIIRAFQIAEPGAVVFSEDDRRIAEIAGINLADPDAYFRLKLAKSGLDDTDVQAFIPVIKMGILRREQTIRYSQVERLYRDGFIGTDRARAEINLAREPAPVVDYRMAALELSREYKVLADTRSATLMAMSRGLITRDEAREQLGRLGMPGDRVELEVLKATLGMIPGVRLEVRAPEELLEGAEVE